VWQSTSHANARTHGCAAGPANEQLVARGIRRARYSARVRFVPASDASLLVVLADTISERATDDVVALFHALDDASPSWLVNLHPAYTTLLIHFDLAATSHHDVEAFVRATPLGTTTAAQGGLVELRVRYDGDDLADVARRCNMSIDDVIACHTAPTYRVAFLGFQPGFAYLLGLDAALTVPRLDAPRARVPAGSVAIGGAQTGVYPREGPGGWRIIGHLADQRALDEAWVNAGDRVRFVVSAP